MTSTTPSQPRIVSESSHPLPPHGRLLVQRVMRDELMCDVIVTAVGADGQIVAEQQDSAALTDEQRLSQIEMTLSTAVTTSLEAHHRN